MSGIRSAASSSTARIGWPPAAGPAATGKAPRTPVEASERGVEEIHRFGVELESRRALIGEQAQNTQ